MQNSKAQSFATFHLALLLLFLAWPGQSSDWLQFRGPLGNGVSPETNLPTQLDAAKHIAWKINLPGRGLSSPIIVGDRVFVTCSSGPNQETLHVICFKAQDGEKLWERQFWATGRTMTHEKTCVAASTPASDGRHVFALFSSNDLVCLDLDGNLVWLRGLTKDYPNVSNSLGMASSLLVAEGVLVVQVENDSESLALGIDAANGVNVWKLERPKAANWTSPQPIKNHKTGQTLIALQSSKGVHAVDPKNGREIWSYLEGASTIPSGAPDQDVLYIPSNGITALKTDTASASPEQIWRSGQLRPATASPLILKDHIYVANSAGILNCGDTKTGQRLWQVRMKGPFSSSPVAAGTHLYFVNEQGLVQVVDTQPAEGAIVGELDLGDTILGTPSIAHGALYFRSDRHLWKVSGTQ